MTFGKLFTGGEPRHCVQLDTVLQSGGVWRTAASLMAVEDNPIVAYKIPDRKPFGTHVQRRDRSERQVRVRT